MKYYRLMFIEAEQYQGRSTILGLDINEGYIEEKNLFVWKGEWLVRDELGIYSVYANDTFKKKNFKEIL